MCFPVVGYNCYGMPFMCWYMPFHPISPPLEPPITQSLVKRSRNDDQEKSGDKPKKKVKWSVVTKEDIAVDVLATLLGSKKS
jgi:hypothetical protein